MDEPVELEKLSVEIQNFMRNTAYLRGIYGKTNLIKKTKTCHCVSNWTEKH